MDCEKFEIVLVDELYGELDELTSVAARRHAAGCARCGARIEGLRATRRLAALARVDPPATLEATVLALAPRSPHGDVRSAPGPRASPWARRAAALVSIAGRWAMRPQTAMAALFLVMVGTSVLLLRGRSSRAPASAHVTVTEEGSPAPTTAYTASARSWLADEPAPLTAQAGTGSNRAGEPKPYAPPASPPSHGPTGDGMEVGAAKSSLHERRAAGVRVAPASRRQVDDEFAAAPPSGGSNPETPRDVAPQQNESTSRTGDPARGEASGPAAAPAETALPATATAPAARDPGPGQGDTFHSAMKAYQAGRFDDARRLFDTLATADAEAGLWAARSLRDGRGCASAVARFDQVSRRVAGTATAWDAQLDAGRCYRQLGNVTTARARLEPLLAVDAYRDRARAELDRIPASPTGGAMP